MHKFEFYTSSVEETQRLARTIASNIKKGAVILLEGPLGSGKTTFTQAFGKQLGITRAIKSPTYTIVKEYPLNEGCLIHIDAYRLEDGGADTIDFEHYLNSENILLIEWSQYLSDYLPNEVMIIQFIPQEAMNERKITIETNERLDLSIAKED